MEAMELKLSELADAAGVSPRTVRYYIAQRLLPPPGRLGPMTRYGREHLDLLRLIKRLQEQRLSLAEIRRRLADAPMPMASSSEPAAPPAAAARPAMPVFGETRDLQPGPMLWERIVVSPDVELHVRRPSSRPHGTKVAQLIDAARAILRSGGIHDG
jgi:DNA-binding transcriptional MerR regulator